MTRAALTAALGVSLLVSGTARATYSIAAVDMSTGQVGGAITSCVGTLDVGIVYGSAPGKGVIHAQALLDQRGRAKMQAIDLLEQGVAPSQIVMQLTAASFDASFESRQYGVVDLMGRAAGFTGADAQAYKHDQQANIGPYAYSVQGNILTSQKVLDQASAAFAGQGCDLPEKLMLALEAGAKNGEGDSRCTDQGIPSDSAFIEVDLMGEAAGSYLKLSVMGTAPASPLLRLREQFDAWRTTHPCMAHAGVAGSGSAGAAAGRDASSGGVGAQSDGGSGASAAGAGANGTVAANGGGGSSAGGAGTNGTVAADGGAAASAGAAGISGTVGADGGTVASAGAAGANGTVAANGDRSASAGAAADGGKMVSAGTNGGAAAHGGGAASAGASGTNQTVAAADGGGAAGRIASARGAAGAATGLASAADPASAAGSGASIAASGQSCGCNLAHSAARRSSTLLAMFALALVLRARRHRS